jgi:2-polyprenyl-3-methyl-5-hydroxy-6-metoxy-1,4-benzoquinol methylase
MEHGSGRRFPSTSLLVRSRKRSSRKKQWPDMSMSENASAPSRWDPNETGQPSSEIGDIASTLKGSARVLDAGCGGAAGNALFLAARGHRVDVFDLSAEAIRSVRQHASRDRLTLNAWVDDVCNFESPGEYDLVICRGVLHFLSPDQSRVAVANLQSATTPSGLNAISIFDDKLPIPDDLKPLVRSVRSEEDLCQQYAGWQIRKCESYVLADEHSGGIAHRHSILRLLAKAP